MIRPLLYLFTLTHAPPTPHDGQQNPPPRPPRRPRCPCARPITRRLRAPAAGTICCALQGAGRREPRKGSGRGPDCAARVRAVHPHLPPEIRAAVLRLQGRAHPLHPPPGGHPRLHLPQGPHPVPVPPGRRHHRSRLPHKAQQVRGAHSVFDPATC